MKNEEPINATQMSDEQLECILMEFEADPQVRDELGRTYDQYNPQPDEYLMASIDELDSRDMEEYYREEISGT